MSYAADYLDELYRENGAVWSGSEKEAARIFSAITGCKVAAEPELPKANRPTSELHAEVRALNSRANIASVFVKDCKEYLFNPFCIVEEFDNTAPDRYENWSREYKEPNAGSITYELESVELAKAMETQMALAKLQEGIK